MSESRTELVHLRLPATLIHSIDACAMVWGVSRAEAASRLIAVGVAEHRGEIVAAMEQTIARLRGEQ